MLWPQAKAAEDGRSLPQVVHEVQETIRQLRALALLDTLKYAVKGGRVSNAILAAESLLSVKAFLTLRDGELHPSGLARNRSKGLNRLREFIRAAMHIEDLAIAYSTTPDEAQTLVDYARSLFPDIVPRIARLGPVLGVHTGPGALAAVIRQGTSPVKLSDTSR